MFPSKSVVQGEPMPMPTKPMVKKPSKHMARRRRKKIASAFLGKAPKQNPMVNSMNQPGAMPGANQGMTPAY